MSQKYALPCVCGHSEPVEQRQAGETIRCPACGKLLEIPKLRELRQLETVQPLDVPREKRGWTEWEGSLFAGGLLAIVIAAGAAGYTYRYRLNLPMEKPDVADFEFPDMNRIPLTTSWEVWKGFKKKQINSRPTPLHVLAQAKADEYDLWLALFGGLAVCGAAAIVGCGISRLTRR